MLPGTTVFLGKKKFAPVRKMIEREIRVAIATDYNPGSCLFNSQPLMMNFAMMYGELTLEEAFKGVTRNAAFSLGRRNVGIINEGAYADLIFWKLNGIHQIPYYNTESAQFITHIIKRGRVFSKLPKVKVPRQPKKEKEETKQ
jgi:imidazolonepropionase